VSILRSKLNSKNAEVEMERLTKAQGLECQAQEYRDKLKELQKELETTRTQLEFKVRGTHILHGKPPSTTFEPERRIESYLQTSLKCQYTVEGPTYKNSFFPGYFASQKM
jgi:hypothetical protein